MKPLPFSSSWKIFGWKIEKPISCEITEGLTYTLEGGVLSPGDSWDCEKADGTRGDRGEIWSIVNTLQYEFSAPLSSGSKPSPRRMNPSGGFFIVP